MVLKMMLIKFLLVEFVEINLLEQRVDLHGTHKKNIVRTNCVDSSDRTTHFQIMIAQTLKNMREYNPNQQYLMK